MLYQKKKVKIDNVFKHIHTWWLYSCNNEKTDDITTFAYYREYL